MTNIFDYLKDVAHDSFYDLPLNELDVLALTETTYLSFDNLVSTTPQRLLDLAPLVPREPNMLTSKNRLQLLDELAQHKRFKNCKLSHFINDIDPELQKQFAAGGDNLGIYIPYFASLDWSQTLVALLVFVIGIIILCEISRVLSSIPLIFETIEKYERIIVPLVFILLGLYIMYENGTIETFLTV